MLKLIIYYGASIEWYYMKHDRDYDRDKSFLFLTFFVPTPKTPKSIDDYNNGGYVSRFVFELRLTESSSILCNGKL